MNGPSWDTSITGGLSPDDLQLWQRLSGGLGDSEGKFLSDWIGAQEGSRRNPWDVFQSTGKFEDFTSAASKAAPQLTSQQVGGFAANPMGFLRGLGYSPPPPPPDPAPKPPTDTRTNPNGWDIPINLPPTVTPPTTTVGGQAPPSSVDFPTTSPGISISPTGSLTPSQPIAGGYVSPSGQPTQSATTQTYPFGAPPVPPAGTQPYGSNPNPPVGPHQQPGQPVPPGFQVDPSTGRLFPINPTDGTGGDYNLPGYTYDPVLGAM